jgi:uncharacterized protein
MKALQKLAYVLVIIGALNWGLVGFFDFNLVTTIFGSVAWLVSVIYDLVGLSAVLLIFNWGKK